MQKWEYCAIFYRNVEFFEYCTVVYYQSNTTENCKPADFASKITELGTQGWELVGVTATVQIEYYFKRPLP